MLYLFNIYYISFNIVVNIGYTVYYELRSQRACRTCKYISRESDMRQLRMRFFRLSRDPDSRLLVLPLLLEVFFDSPVQEVGSRAVCHRDITSRAYLLSSYVALA